jgi:hypothetical protein
MIPLSDQLCNNNGIRNLFWRSSGQGVKRSNTPKSATFSECILDPLVRRNLKNIFRIQVLLRCFFITVTQSSTIAFVGSGNCPFLFWAPTCKESGGSRSRQSYVFFAVWVFHCRKRPLAPGIIINKTDELMVNFKFKKHTHPKPIRLNNNAKYARIHDGFTLDC